MEGDPAGGAARERRGRGGAHPPFPSQRRPPAAPPRLSEDPSGHPPRPELFAKLAAAYGSSLAWRGRALAERLVPLRRLKCYFAVDTRYVEQKLARLLFPFGHQVSGGGGGVLPLPSLPPPSVCLGRTGRCATSKTPRGAPLRRQCPRPLHPRFSPDLLGLLASSTLAWLIMEVLAILVCLYLVAVNTELTPIDLIAFSGYKYVGMIAGLLAGLLFGKTGYYMLLGRCCVTVFVFTISSLCLKILSEATEGVPRRDTKNQVRMYLTMAVAGLQPLLMCWLAFQLIY